MGEDLGHVWKITLAQIEVNIDSPAHFKTWFLNTSLKEIDSSTAKVGVNNSYAADWLRKHHYQTIKRILSYNLNRDIELEFSIDSSLANKKPPQIETPLLSYCLLYTSLLLPTSPSRVKGFFNIYNIFPLYMTIKIIYSVFIIL